MSYTWMNNRIRELILLESHKINISNGNSIDSGLFNTAKIFQKLGYNKRYIFTHQENQNASTKTER